MLTVSVKLVKNDETAIMRMKMMAAIMRYTNQPKNTKPEKSDCNWVGTGKTPMNIIDQSKVGDHEIKMFPMAAVLSKE